VTRRSYVNNLLGIGNFLLQVFLKTGLYVLTKIKVIFCSKNALSSCHICTCLGSLAKQIQSCWLPVASCHTTQGDEERTELATVLGVFSGKNALKVARVNEA
jgi:hypothetical protein